MFNYVNLSFLFNAQNVYSMYYFLLIIMHSYGWSRSSLYNSILIKKEKIEREECAHISLFTCIYTIYSIIFVFVHILFLKQRERELKIINYNLAKNMPNIHEHSKGEERRRRKKKHVVLFFFLVLLIIIIYLLS